MVALSPTSQEIGTSQEIERPASEQILRLFSRFIGAGYLFYLVVSVSFIPPVAAITASWWTPVALVLFFGPGLAMGIASFLPGRGRLLASLAVVSAVGYLVGLATWPVGWTGGHLPDGASTWFSLFPALSSLGAAVSLAPRWAFLHLAIVTVGAQTINHLVRDVDDRSPLAADLVYGFGFSLIFVAASITASRTGFLLDRTRRSTHAQAASSAAVQARTVERKRFDGLIHDNVMSTLLAASREPMDDRLVGQARVALRELDTLRDDAESTHDFPTDDVVSHLRASAASVDPSMRLDVTAAPDADGVPADTVRTVGAAMAEALRNSLRHAGSDARRTIVVVVSRGGLRVTVQDDGSGYDLSAVPAHRLGVRVSILERMQRLPGGAVSIASSVGLGTTVDLRWERP